MSNKSIKVQRKESILVELLNEALSTLNDSRLNSLTVLEVVCSRGASDAKVYLEKSLLTKDEQKEALKLLRKANGLISKYCLESTGWLTQLFKALFIGKTFFFHPVTYRYLTYTQFLC
jgi:ribosome-binding factor A